ncbi:MAG: hypothetical protein LBP53_06130 [Candidatus Peribacteria bacterium]|nr:hypothetical protein [Candidatus Peribacteria bacterium]
MSVFEITHREPTLRCFFTTFRVTLVRALFGKKRYDIILLEYGIDRP